MSGTRSYDDSPALRSLRIGGHVLFGLLLAIALARLVGAGGVPWHGWIIVALTVGWYVLGAGLVRGGPARTKVWIAGLVAFWLALTVVSAEFSWIAFPIFLVAVGVLPVTSAIVVVTVMTSVVVVAQLASGSGNVVSQIIGPVVGAVVAVGIGLGYQQILAESRERGRLVGELTSAHGDLLALQEELAQAQREAGALGERARLARDIHDTLAQGFSSILLLARAGAASEVDTANQHLFEQIRDVAAENLTEARAVVNALRPEALSDAPLPAAVQRLLDRLHEQTGILAELHVEGRARPLPTIVEVGLLRLCQGALGNVRSHSRANRVSVTLNYEEDLVLLDIVDDGVGFDPATTRRSEREGSGFGLQAMGERLAALGGTFTVESAPGEGTAVAASVPLTGGAS